jgi:aspartyl-tRNA(Asn)/glutamyl-tRNA(Gln) amidotransferase subunit C
MSATKEEVLRIAKLARIEINPSEIADVQKKFGAILEHFKILEEVDTDGTEPLFHAAKRMDLRADRAEPPLSRDALLANAPDNADGAFRIPKVIGESL